MSARMLGGKIKMWNSERGFGFIRRDDGEADVFVHAKDLQRAGIVGNLEPGDTVRFLIAAGRDGRSRASEIELVARAAGAQ